MSLACMKMRYFPRLQIDLSLAGKTFMVQNKVEWINFSKRYNKRFMGVLSHYEFADQQELRKRWY